MREKMPDKLLEVCFRFFVSNAICVFRTICLRFCHVHQVLQYIIILNTLCIFLVHLISFDITRKEKGLIFRQL